jgi:hypothetical protein
MRRVPSYFRTLTGANTMAIQTYYVQGKSKKEINERLANETPANRVIAVCRSMMNEHTTPLICLNDGDVIKIWEKEVNGSPYAKAYGNWDSKKQRVK